MDRQAFINWAVSRGWVQDRYGHLKKDTADKQYRFKLSRVAVRYEVRVNHSDGSKSWIRLRSGYFSKLSVNGEGKLSGLRS